MVLVYRWWRVDICTWSNLLTKYRCSRVLLYFWSFTFPFLKKKIHWKISSGKSCIVFAHSVYFLSIWPFHSSGKSCTVFTHSVYFLSIWPFHWSSSVAQLFILVITIAKFTVLQWRRVYSNMIQKNIETSMETWKKKLPKV